MTRNSQTDWKTSLPWHTNNKEQFKELMQQYRPKMIREYEENGHMVHVYEARYVY